MVQGALRNQHDPCVRTTLVNPGKHICPTVTARGSGNTWSEDAVNLHGITPGMVQGWPSEMEFILAVRDLHQLTAALVVAQMYI